MKRLIALCTSAIFIGCCNKNTTEIITPNEDTLQTIEKTEEKEIIDFDEFDIEGTSTSYYRFPADEDELKRWKQKIYEEADVIRYDLLEYYYSNYPDEKDEMVALTQIMIDKYGAVGGFSMVYFDCVSRCKLPEKRELIKKGIEYLSEAAKDSHTIMGCQAAEYLASIYREGVYVKKDTIIADYLEKGGGNLDSMKLVRKYSDIMYLLK